MNEPVQEPVAPAQAARREITYGPDGRIAEDLVCRLCGYNLRGLDPMAMCPECSTPVGRSIHGNLLQFCDPVWLDRLGLGLRLIVIGSLVGVGFVIVYVVVAAAVAGGSPGGTLVGAGGVIGTGISLITVTGVWMLTAPDPGAGDAEHPLSARRLARWCMSAQLVTTSLQFYSGLGWANPMTTRTPLQNFVTVAAMTVGVLVLIGTAAGLIYLRGLADRIPRPTLARQTRIVTWGYVVSQAFGIIVGLVFVAMLPGWMTAAGTTGAMSPGMVAASFGSCVVGLGSLVFGVWTLVLLFMYIAALKAAAAQARSSWAGATT